MKILIAVKSCMRDWMNGSHRVIRETWGKYIDWADLRFFYGNGAGWMLGPDQDEIHIDCDDSYEKLPFKVREICCWAVKNKYDAVYLCDNDTFLHSYRLEGLIDSLLNDFVDYAGRFYWDEKDPTVRTGTYRFAFGGFGYLLSNRAAGIIADSPDPDIIEEDQWVGRELSKVKTLLTTELNRERFGRHIAWHFPKNVYKEWPRYYPSVPWQESMTQHHILRDTPSWESWGTYSPDVVTFPKNPQECRRHTRIEVIDNQIKLLREKDLLDLVVSFTALDEAEQKQIDCVSLIEWSAIADCYRHLGFKQEQLVAALNAFSNDYSCRGRIGLAKAQHAAGNVKEARDLVLAVYRGHEEIPGLLNLLRKLNSEVGTR